MDEAILIEISQRFRLLEDAIDALHPDTEFVRDSEFDPADEEEPSPRAQLERLAEACRDDLAAMQDAIRKAAQ